MNIDRKRVVQRHHPKMTRIEPLSPLAVGNGCFAFTADVTGLQTFPEAYQVPLGTQSEWGWHSTTKRDLYTHDDIAFQQLDTYGRNVGYPLDPKDREEAYHWLRQNPHRLQLGRLSFRFLKENGAEAVVDDLEQIEQELNLWEGILYSRYKVAGHPVTVVTSCHPELDQLGVRVQSSLIAAGRLQVVLRFPNPDMTSRVWEQSIDLNWEHDERHRSSLVYAGERRVTINRVMDEDGYAVHWQWNGGQLKQTGDHTFVLTPQQHSHELQFTVVFQEDDAVEDDVVGAGAGLDPLAIEQASKRHWEQFWLSGGAVDFSGSTDERAGELERRVVLSQFLLAIHSAGTMPPQETGLLYNSWFGKFHLEMHWWHGVHFPLWGRASLLARSLDWYTKILPQAKQLARSQGYKGARWPKQVGPNGLQSPSPIAPALIWQQPHPIAMAEFCYLADPKRETLLRWKEVVEQTAHFMVSYAIWNEEKNAYVLGPPLIPAQENHHPMDSMNPPYELEYWKYGLEIAIRWMERLQLSIDPLWRKVADSLAEPPHADGVYLAHENCPDTFTKYNHDHPSMVGALGMLPGHLIDREIMRNTIRKVYSEWQWDTSWGWDFPMCAMTAARLGETELAVDFLLMEAAKNTYLPNGHNYQRVGLTAYLPGNGALLMAIAMMASGWKGNVAKEGQAPGFPQDGSWNVRWEGLISML